LDKLFKTDAKIGNKFSFGRNYSKLRIFYQYLLKLFTEKNHKCRFVNKR
jgi:endo-1,4-beta-D-glucanase Y